MKKLLRVLASFAILCAASLGWIAASAAGTGGLTFDGLTLHDTKSRTFALPCTYEATVILPENYSSRGGVILGNYNGERKPLFSFEILEKGVPRIYIEATDNSGEHVNYDARFSEINVAMGKPVHIAITMDRATGIWQCYIDGQLKQMLQQSVPDHFEITDALRLGGDFRTGNTQRFKGTILRAAVYSDVRSPREIASDATGNELSAEEIICGYDLSAYTPENAPATIPSVSGSDFALTGKCEWLREQPPLEDYAYSIAVLGDIQTLSCYYPDELNTMYKWIRDNAESKKIKYVIGLGDITDKNTPEEFERVQEAYSFIDGVVPFSIVRGNHDSEASYKRYITKDLYGDEITDSYNTSMLNTYRILQVGEVKYLFMNLDLRLENKVLKWADKIISQNPDCHVIVSTHIYMNTIGSYHKMTKDSPLITQYHCENNGEGLWQKVLSKHENVVMLLCGHSSTDNIIHRQRMGSKGNLVTEVLIDPQVTDKNYSGTGLVAMFYFSEDGRQLQVRYYSTVKDAYFKGNNQFRLTLDVPDQTVPQPATEPASEPTVLPTTESVPTQPEVPEKQSPLPVILLISAGALAAGYLAIRKIKK